MDAKEKQKLQELVENLEAKIKEIEKREEETHEKYKDVGGYKARSSQDNKMYESDMAILGTLQKIKEMVIAAFSEVLSEKEKGCVVMPSMNYRLEYGIQGAETSGSGKKNFEANSDNEAASMVKGILNEEEDKINKDIKQRFWRFSVHFHRLVKITQPEISEKVSILSLTH